MCRLYLIHLIGFKRDKNLLYTVNNFGNWAIKTVLYWLTSNENN